jgi:hypothetical protein
MDPAIIGRLFSYLTKGEFSLIKFYISWIYLHRNSMYNLAMKTKGESK